MQDFVTPEIKHRPDGSIDTAHYINLGRRARAAQARSLVQTALPKRRTFSLPFWFLGTSAT